LLELLVSRMTLSTMISRGRRASRVRERREDERLGAYERCGEFPFGERCGNFPFGERDGVLLPPDMPVLLDGGGDQPWHYGEVITAQVPSYGSDANCWSPDGGEHRRAGHEQRWW